MWESEPGVNPLTESNNMEASSDVADVTTEKSDWCLLASHRSSEHTEECTANDCCRDALKDTKGPG